MSKKETPLPLWFVAFSLLLWQLYYSNTESGSSKKCDEKASRRFNRGIIVLYYCIGKIFARCQPVIACSITYIIHWCKFYIETTEHLRMIKPPKKSQNIFATWRKYIQLWHWREWFKVHGGLIEQINGIKYICKCLCTLRNLVNNRRKKISSTFFITQHFLTWALFTVDRDGLSSWQTGSTIYR